MANISSDWEPARAQPATLEAAAAAAAADAQPLVTEAVAGALTRVSDARTPLAVPAGLPGGRGGGALSQRQDAGASVKTPTIGGEETRKKRGRPKASQVVKAAGLDTKQPKIDQHLSRA